MQERLEPPSQEEEVVLRREFLSEAASLESCARHLVTAGMFLNSIRSSGSNTSTTPYRLISLMTAFTLSRAGFCRDRERC